jgi:serine/threonine-protein kinase
MDQSTDPTWRRWQEVDRIFAAALDLPEPARSTFLTDSCGNDWELHDAVVTLLAAEAESAGMFETPDVATTRAALRELSETVGGADGVADLPRVGTYRLLRELGRGGMGTVYLAERADADFEQRVAVKLLRRGLDTDDVVRRFLSERRILAGLEHPNIGRLYDGGSTEDGRPFLVMEYVDGTTITTYCDQHALTIRERLQLFLHVADAVRYAHTKLVVHRDLKPSNILVTSDGLVKLLDFGIAKLLSSTDDADGDGLTRTGVHLFTPEYASPEQRRGEPITTASDVYQLGTLLYVLLTGRRPFQERGRLADQATGQPVTAPSVVIGENTRVRNALRGDLDTIVLKALRDETARRYDSVERLARDVRAHLEGRPVSARPDTLRYRTGKFLRRHAWIAPGTAGLLVVLTLYLVSSARHTAAVELERNAARAEAERASEVQRLLVELFRSADPFEPADPERGRAITVVEAMDLGADRVLNELENRPRIQASLLDALAEVYTNLGAHDKALPLAARAVSLHERVHGVGSAQYRAGLARLAHTQFHDVDSALALFRRRLELALSARGPLHAEVAEARVDVAAHLYHTLSRLLEAEVEYAHVLAMADSTDVPAEELAEAHRGLADIYGTLGRPADAEPHARRSVMLHRELFGETSPNTAMAYESMAKVLGAVGKTKEAEVEFERAIEVLTNALGPEHGNTLSALNNLALLRRQAGDLGGAEEALRRLVALQTQARGAGHREVGSTYQNLGAVLADQDKLNEAAEMHARAAAIYDAVLARDNYLTALPYLSLAGVALNRGNFHAAEGHARRALRILEATLPADHYATAVARCRVGRALAGQRRLLHAAPLLQAAVDALQPDTPVPAAYRKECVDALAAVSGSKAAGT